MLRARWSSHVRLGTNFKAKNATGTTRYPFDTHTEETRQNFWNLQDAKKPFKIKWKILKKCKPYRNITKKCSLCLYKKFIIICKKQLCSLNRGNELPSSCPHRNRYVLRNLRITKLKITTHNSSYITFLSRSKYSNSF